jgi:hypothetical protein
MFQLQGIVRLQGVRCPHHPVGLLDVVADLLREINSTVTFGVVLVYPVGNGHR